MEISSLSRFSFIGTHNLWIAQDNRQPLLACADHDDFGVLALGQFPRRLDAFPLQEIFVQALIDDCLIVGNSLGFDPLAFGFLFLLVQHILHLLGLLFRLEFAFDSC